MRIRLFILLLVMAACSGNKAESQEFAHKRVSLEEFKQILKDKGVQLVDVRTPGEYTNGFIENAINIDFKSPTFKTDCEKTLDKGRPVAIYCAMGGRSARALEILKAAGFTEVYELGVGYKGYNP